MAGPVSQAILSAFGHRKIYLYLVAVLFVFLIPMARPKDKAGLQKRINLVVVFKCSKQKVGIIFSLFF